VISGLMAAIVLLTLAQVFFRYVLDRPLEWSEELARYCFVWLTFVGAATLLRRRDSHPAVDSIHSHIAPGAQRFIQVTARVLVIVCSLAIATGAFRLIYLQWRQLSPAVELPMVAVYACLFVAPLLGVFWVLWTMRFGHVEDEA